MPGLSNISTSKTMKKHSNFELRDNIQFFELFINCHNKYVCNILIFYFSWLFIVLR